MTESRDQLRQQVERLEALRERAKLPARQQALDKRISRARKRLGGRG